VMATCLEVDRSSACPLAILFKMFMVDIMIGVVLRCVVLYVLCICIVFSEAKK
jgi:hypothetical protein